MGSFMYLINEEEKIYVEVCQCSASGHEVSIFSNNGNLRKFLDYCYENILDINVKHDGFFECLEEGDDYTKFNN